MCASLVVVHFGGIFYICLLLGPAGLAGGAAPPGASTAGGGGEGRMPRASRFECFSSILYKSYSMLYQLFVKITYCYMKFNSF